MLSRGNTHSGGDGKGLSCAILQNLQEGDTVENRPALPGSGAGDDMGKGAAAPMTASLS